MPLLKGRARQAKGGVGWLVVQPAEELAYEPIPRSTFTGGCCGERQAKRDWRRDRGRARER